MKALYGLNNVSCGTQALKEFIRDIGAPTHIYRDNFKIQTGKVWKDVIRKFKVKDITTEPYHP